MDAIWSVMLASKISTSSLGVSVIFPAESMMIWVVC
jgi:hypothetical protein